MIDVDGVLHQHLPIGMHRIFMRAGQNRAAVLVLVENHVEIAARLGEIELEALGLAAEASEQPAAIILRAHLVKPQLLGLEAGTIGIAPRHADQPALIVVAPIMIEALEVFGVAGGVTAHHRAAVAAAVVKEADLAVTPANDEDRPAADAAGEEIARLRHLAFMSGIKP